MKRKLFIATLLVAMLALAGCNSSGPKDNVFSKTWDNGDSIEIKAVEGSSYTVTPSSDDEFKVLDKDGKVCGAGKVYRSLSYEDFMTPTAKLLGSSDRTGERNISVQSAAWEDNGQYYEAGTFGLGELTTVILVGNESLEAIQNADQSLMISYQRAKDGTDTDVDTDVDTDTDKNTGDTPAITGSEDSLGDISYSIPSGYEKDTISNDHSYLYSAHDSESNLLMLNVYISKDDNGSLYDSTPGSYADAVETTHSGITGYEYTDVDKTKFAFTYKSSSYIISGDNYSAYLEMVESIHLN